MLTSAMTLDQAFALRAREHPDREALVCGQDRVTYGDLSARAQALASGLQRLGVGGGDRVVSLLPPGWHFAVLFLALARLGAVAVPVNPQFRQRLLEHIVREAEPAVAVVAAEGTAENLSTIRAMLREAAPVCRLIVAGAGVDDALSLSDLMAAPAAPLAPTPAAPDDLVAILYTSGTTGLPKGVMHSHRGLISPVVASLRLRRMWLRKPTPAQLARMAGLLARYGTRLLQAAGRPQTFLTAIGGHAIAGIEAMLQALLMGDRLVLMPRFHPVEALRLIERERVTVLIAPPLALSLLVRLRDLERYDLSSLLICGTGSAPCPAELARQVQERFGCAIHIGYGTTEVGGGISATSVEDSAERQAETVGRAMSGMEVRVVDEERRPLPPGQVGELACRSESRMLGYYRAADLTQEVLDEEGWYYTGDLAVMDEQGFIRIVGRKKDLIIRGGQNIYPEEIEQFLARHERIREAAVVGVPGPSGDERVWAYVLPEEGGELSAQEVLQYCRTGLEAFKIPDQVRLVSELPRSGLGKVQKTALRAMAAADEASPTG
ncbi:MAG: class I adenylate-forming enzyme family protein [Anaerolineae bacterium]|nr:class I adenylate-forming enzyme family protein [Anaerolineae bacterium]